MVSRDLLESVVEIAGWFPGSLVRGVTDPIDEVFKLIVADPRIEDFLDFVFQGILDGDGWRRRLNTPRDGICMVGIHVRNQV